jgi:dGTPase
MPDDFYCDFDRDYLRDEFNPERKADYRSVFHQDRDRIMFTPAFRRLQAKTQVFQAGEYDFYRTRLTHSMEVANIAKSIAVWLRVKTPAVEIDPDLLEAICLAHDIGHPPFGHSGERVLNDLMEPYGGFEGNAQTLRILTRTIYNRGEGRGGMSPSRALLDGVLKYKRLHRDRGAAKNHFIYDDQAEILEFCFGTRELPGDANELKSVECQVMDLADDIAYSCFDVVDGAKARFLTPDRLRAWGEKRELDEVQRQQLDELIGMMAEDKLQPKMNGIIGKLIQGAVARPKESFLKWTRRHAYLISIHEEVRARIKLHKAICRELIFGWRLPPRRKAGSGFTRRCVAILFSARARCSKSNSRAAIFCASWGGVCSRIISTRKESRSCSCRTKCIARSAPRNRSQPARACSATIFPA